MNTENRSRLPWSLSGYHAEQGDYELFDADGEHVLSVQGFYAKMSQNQTNAEFVVHAVNNIERMEAVCRAAQDYLLCIEDMEGVCAIQEARKTLTAAVDAWEEGEKP